MKNLAQILIAIALTGMTAWSAAQTVKGNEAVTVSGDGKRTVSMPPAPKTLPSACPAVESCAPGGWLMLETPKGLEECTELYGRPTTCRPSTYGSEKKTRLWIVKYRGTWVQCQYPDLSSKCVPLSALPYPAVQ